MWIYYNGIDEEVGRLAKNGIHTQILMMKPFQDNEKYIKEVLTRDSNGNPFTFGSAYENDNYDLSAQIVILGESKKTEINEITGQLIIQGFEYDSKHFNLSRIDQINWTGLYAMRTTLSWPQESTTSDGETYSLTQTKVEDIAAIIYDIINKPVTGYRTTGRVLKTSVRSAITAEDLTALKAVTDDRLDTGA